MLANVRNNSNLFLESDKSVHCPSIYHLDLLFASSTNCFLYGQEQELLMFFGRLVVSSLLFLIMIKTIGGLNLQILVHCQLFLKVHCQLSPKYHHNTKSFNVSFVLLEVRDFLFQSWGKWKKMILFMLVLNNQGIDSLLLLTASRQYFGTYINCMLSMSPVPLSVFDWPTIQIPVSSKHSFLY